MMNGGTVVVRQQLEWLHPVMMTGSVVVAKNFVGLELVRLCNDTIMIKNVTSKKSMDVMNPI